MPQVRSLSPPTVRAELIGFLVLALLLSGSAAALLGKPGVLLQALVVAGVMVALVGRAVTAGGAPRGLGLADRITLLRASGVAVLAGLPFQATLADPVLWAVVATASLLLILDGVDGAVARRTGTASDFGARFDMELDAFFILVLCLLLWQRGDLGVWVLLVGLLRYIFVGAGLLLPALRAPLPESLARKTVCVVQVVALLISLAPWVSAGWAAGIMLTALALLVASFAADVRWLLRHGANGR